MPGHKRNIDYRKYDYHDHPIYQLLAQAAEEERLVAEFQAFKLTQDLLKDLSL